MDVTATSAALSTLRAVVGLLDDAACDLDSPPMGTHVLLGEVTTLLDHARDVEQDFERLRREELEELDASDQIEDLRGKFPNFPKTDGD